MKQFWVDLRRWDKECATTAIEAGADVIVTDSASLVRELGRIQTVAPDGDLVPETDVFFIDITGKADEEQAAERGKHQITVVSTSDWTIIPLENLVAQSDHIIAVVHNVLEAEAALGVLETGVSGVCLVTTDPAVIRAVGNLMHGATGDVAMTPCTILAVKPAGMGDRVCVDTCSVLEDGEGLVVGNTSSSFLLVHAETLENPYVAPRPFRVNAGAVHAYCLMADGKTAYLSELKSGDMVLVSGATGRSHPATVGRVKIERRPLLLVEAESEGRRFSLILQNAETIRLVRPDSSAVSVVDLKAGDVVLGHLETGGRHFGHAIEETIVEQ